MHLLSRRRLIEKARVFLRDNDFVSGYFPQLVMAERPSEWWSLFWYFVRRLDNLLDEAKDTRSRGEDVLRQLMDSDAGAALQVFLAETADRVPLRLIKRLYQSTEEERLAFSDGKAPAAGHYLRLIEQKSVTPVWICACLNGLDPRDPLVNTLAVSMGRGIQLLDDLFDLVRDRQNGRLFITREELSLLGLEEHQIDANLERVAQLRGQWIMAAVAPAYDAVHRLPDNEFCVIARSWIEATWRLIADGKAVPLASTVLDNDAALARYLGVSTVPFNLVPASEQVKYRLLHTVTVTFLRRYRIFDASRLGRLHATSGVALGPLLESLGGAAAERALPIAESWGREDSRRLVDLDESSLPRIENGEISTILLAAGAEVADDFLTRLHRGDAAEVVANLVNSVAADWHAVLAQDVDRRSKAVRATVASDGGVASPLLDLVLDWVSLTLEHGLAFQADLVNWRETRRAKGPG